MRYPFPKEIGKTKRCSVCKGETEPTFDPWTGGVAGRRCIKGKCGHDGQIQEHAKYTAKDGTDRCIFCGEPWDPTWPEATFVEDDES